MLHLAKTKESKQIDDLICGLPEPPVRPGPPEDLTKFMIPIEKSADRPRAAARESKGAGVANEPCFRWSSNAGSWVPMKFEPRRLERLL